MAKNQTIRFDGEGGMVIVPSSSSLGPQASRSLMLDHDGGVYGYATYLRALLESKLPHDRRARSPYRNHPWVYAAASAIADNLSQVDFVMYRETADQQKKRAEDAVKRGFCKGTGVWVGSYGKERMFVPRHLHTKQRFKGRVNRAIEQDYDHPFSRVLANPNPLMSGTAFWKLEDTYFSLYGEGFGLLISKSGAPFQPGDELDMILPMHPQDCEPIIDPATNLLVAWRYTVSTRGEGMGIGPLGSVHEFLESEVLHFKDVDPDYVVRGLSKLAPAAASIRQDLAAQSHNTSVLENNADPGGILSHPDELDDRLRKKLLKRWTDRHGGPLNRRKITLLDGGLKWEKTSLTMEDLQFGELRGVNRDEVLATLRATKSVMGLTEDLNFATQLSQDRNFWNKTLSPRVKVYEGEFDRKVMLNRPDTEAAGFKLEDVDALQEDLSKKVETINVLCSQNIHMPPRVAIDLVSIDVQQFEGDDVAFVPPTSASVKGVLEAEEEFGAGGMDVGGPSITPTGTNEDDPISNDPQPKKPEQGAAPNNADYPSKKSLRSLFAARRGVTVVTWSAKQRKRRDKIAKEYARLLSTHEPQLGRAYKSHVYALRKAVLSRWDSTYPSTKAMIIKADGSITDQELELILFNAQRAGVKLATKALPIYQAILESSVEFSTEELGGLYSFDELSPTVQRFLQRKAVKIAGVDSRLRERLRESLVEGRQNGEGQAELRERIKNIFNRAVSPGRIARIARTESAQMFSGIREIIHSEEGVSRHEWTTAGDEHVREDHVTFGASGEHRRGFNFMELVRRPNELLRYPSDVEGPADEVVACRCVSIATG